MQFTLIFLLALAFVAIQAFIGGAKLFYGLPCYGLFAVAGVWAAFLPWKRSEPTPRIFCVIASVLLAGYVVIRSQMSPVEYLARPDFFMILGALLVYWLVSIHLTDATHRLALFWVLLAFSLVHTSVGAIQFRQEDNYMLIPWIFRPNYFNRASGFYICPNHFAGLVEMLSMFAMAICCWARVRGWVRLLAGYAFVACVAGLAITGSRGGYLSEVFGMCVFACLSLWAIRGVRRKLFWPLFGGAIVVIVALVSLAVFVMLHSELLSSRLGTVYDPTNMRLLIWPGAIEQFKLSPVFGTGSGTFLYFGRQFRHAFVQNGHRGMLPRHPRDGYRRNVTDSPLCTCCATP